MLLEQGQPWGGLRVTAAGEEKRSTQAPASCTAPWPEAGWDSSAARAAHRRPARSAPSAAALPKPVPQGARDVRSHGPGPARSHLGTFLKEF